MNNQTESYFSSYCKFAESLGLTIEELNTIATQDHNHDNQDIKELINNFLAYKASSIQYIMTDLINEYCYLRNKMCSKDSDEKKEALYIAQVFVDKVEEYYSDDTIQLRVVNTAE